MALDQESTLLAAVQAVPDPRKARGKRYACQLLLTIIVAGLASNYVQSSPLQPIAAQLSCHTMTGADPSVPSSR